MSLVKKKQPLTLLWSFFVFVFVVVAVSVMVELWSEWSTS